MGLLEFNKLPINTLVGADWKTFNAITKGREIDAAYKGKFRLTKAVCRMLSTLAPLQDKRYEKLLADKPLEHDIRVRITLSFDEAVHGCTTLYLSSVTGVAEQLSCIMCSLATSISAITQRIRPYFRI